VTMLLPRIGLVQSYCEVDERTKFMTEAKSHLPKTFAHPKTVFVVRSARATTSVVRRRCRSQSVRRL
jgi:hypothetical protein